MMKHIKDSENGLLYTLAADGNYYPDLTLPKQTNYPLGRWAQERLAFIKAHRRWLYTQLLTNGTLNTYLHDTDTECSKMYRRLVDGYAAAEGIDETMKAKDQLLWVAKMNNIRERVEEVIRAECIYV